MAQKKKKKEYLWVFAAGIAGILIVSIMSVVLAIDMNTKLVKINEQLEKVSSIKITCPENTTNITSKISRLHLLLKTLETKSKELSKKYNVGVKPLLEGFSTNPVGCEEPGKVVIYAFHSPTCPYCEAQREVLKSIAQNYSNKVDIRYICVSVHPGDEEKCKASTDYLPYNIGQQIYQKYKYDVSGTPTLVFNCEYSRVGSYAVYDKQKGTHIETDLLKTIINTLLTS